MAGVFFSESEYALQRITDIFDIIHPIRLSYWHTMSHVKGVKIQYPQITEAQFNSSFGLGANIHGVNFKKAFINCDWTTVEQTLAWILLSSLFSIYEGWIAAINNNIFQGHLDTVSFQVPNNPNITRLSIIDSIQNLLQNKSQFMENTIFPEYSTQKHYSFGNLNSLLKCFRFFKEMRNCFTHNSSITDSKLVAAYSEFILIATTQDLGLDEVPEHYPPILNQPVQISLRGVIGFSAIIVKIITTCDAKLLISELIAMPRILFLRNLNTAHMIEKL